MSDQAIYKNKNDFSCIAFKGSNPVNKLEFVHSIKQYGDWLDKKGIDWSIINVYARRGVKGSNFIKRYYKTDILPKRPEGT